MIDNRTSSGPAFYPYLHFIQTRKRWLQDQKRAGRRAFRYERWLERPYTPATEWLKWRDPIFHNINSYQLMVSNAYYEQGDAMEMLISERKPWKLISNKTMPLFRESIGDKGYEPVL
jgi:hypothetical protein